MSFSSVSVTYNPGLDWIRGRVRPSNRPKWVKLSRTDGHFSDRLRPLDWIIHGFFEITYELKLKHTHIKI